MVNRRQVYELHRDIVNSHGWDLVWPPSDLLILRVCAHHHTYNNNLVEVNHTQNIDWFPMPTSVLQSDVTARALFSGFAFLMGVAVDDLLLRDLLSLLRAMNDDRTVIAHAAIPLVVLVVTVQTWPSNHESTDDDELAMEEDYEALKQMVPTSQSSLDTLEKVIVDCSCFMDQCMICLEKFCVDNDQLDQVLVTRMPCSHVYHGDCIDGWLKTSHFCPLCRFEMPT